MSNDVLGQLVKKLVQLPEGMFGTLLDLLLKLSGQHGEEWFEKLKKFLRGELVVKLAYGVFPTWKTILLGTHKNAGALKSAITDAGFRIWNSANFILGKRAFSIASEEISLELVTASVRELGFTKYTRYDAICARIRELGYDLCPAEVGPQLRLQYKDQPFGELLVIAMEAISDWRNDLLVFVVEHCSDGLRLNAYSGHPCRFFDPDDRFVFVRRKLSTNA